MKKYLFIFILFFAFVFTAYSQTGVIHEITGEVEIKPAGSQSFLPAAAGTEVAQDTIVSTGFKSTAVIQIGSTSITVRPLTRLSLAEISGSADEENLNVNLQAGRLRVDVKPPAGTRANTKIQSPTATASVRGTSFDMDTVSISVIEGNVGFAGSDGLSTPVTAGFTSEINADGAAVDANTLAAVSVMPAAPVGADAGLAGSTSVTVTEEGDFDVAITW